MATNPVTKEQAEQELALRLFKSVEKLTESIPTLLERVKAIEVSTEAFKGIDPKSVLANMEKLQAGFDRVKRQIATNSSHGLYLAGLEDESEQSRFSMLRAVMGVKAGGSKEAFERVKAGYEWEVMSQIRAKAESSGHIIGVDSQGGFFVPDQVIPDVIAAIYTRSVLIDLAGDGQTRVSVLDGLTGVPVTIPKFEGGVIAYWIGEEDDYAESKAAVGNVTLRPRKLGILTKLTNEMRRFQSFGFENMLRNDMIRALAKKMDWTVMYGRGTDNAPRGIMSMENVLVYRAENGTVYEGLAAARAASNWVGGTLNFDGLDNMKGALEDIDIDPDEGGSFAYISAPRYFRGLRQLKIDNYTGQTANQPYLLGSPMIREETLRSLIGDFGRTTQVASANPAGASIGATASGGGANPLFGDVIGGNLSEVVVGRWSGIEIEDDEGKGKDFVKDVTNVKMRMYADVGARHERAIVVCPDAKMRTA